MNTISSQLSALLSQFDETFRNLSQKSEGKGALSKENMINDVRALKALLSGVQNKAPETGGAQAQAGLWGTRPSVACRYPQEHSGVHMCDAQACAWHACTMIGDQ